MNGWLIAMAYVMLTLLFVLAFCQAGGRADE